MNELTRAYETLGLPENAGKDEVEKRYALLLRRVRAAQQRHEAGEEIEAAERNFEEINRAYKLILEAEERKTISEINEQQYGKYKRFAGTAQKLDHFFSYYKWHVIGGIAIIVLIIYGVNGYLDRQAEKARLAALPPAEMTATMLGKFMMSDNTTETEPLEEAIVAQMPDWQRVEVNLLTFDMNGGSQLDVAMQQKVVVQLATEKPDAYILDKDTFAWIVGTGVLRPLDEDVASWPNLPPDAAYKAATEDDPVERIYGIDIGASPLADQLPVAMQDMIVGIRLDAANPDNVLRFIEQYLQAGQ